jgi:hypothetical protein
MANVLADSTINVQASGYSGGWTRWDIDTIAELQTAIDGALRAAGLTPTSLVVDAGDDFGGRVVHNVFPYVMKATVKVHAATTDAALREAIRSRLQRITDQSVTVSLTTLGEPDLSGNVPRIELPSLGQLNLSLGLVVAVIVGVVVLKVFD